MSKSKYFDYIQSLGYDLFENVGCNDKHFYIKNEYIGISPERGLIIRFLVQEGTRGHVIPDKQPLTIENLNNIIDETKAMQSMVNNI